MHDLQHVIVLHYSKLNLNLWSFYMCYMYSLFPIACRGKNTYNHAQFAQKLRHESPEMRLAVARLELHTGPHKAIKDKNKLAYI